MDFYKDHYKVVIIGGALSGLSTALQLQQKGITDILILEKHNLPGALPRVMSAAALKWRQRSMK